PGHRGRLLSFLYLLLPVANLYLDPVTRPRAHEMLFDLRELAKQGSALAGLLIDLTEDSPKIFEMVQEYFKQNGKNENAPELAWERLTPRQQSLLHGRLQLLLHLSARAPYTPAEADRNI